MKYSDIISGIFWLVLGLLLSIWSTCYHIGSLINPGAGFFPLALGILLILLSIALLLGQVKNLTVTKETVTPSLLQRGRRKTTYTILILLLATFLYEKIGYLLTAFLLIVFLMQGVGSWKKILFIALITALGVYVVFVRLLKQPFPRGILGI